mmetsp:Transcript_8241/g.28914  ORF Transcript_8241/g.28914 Transcript_8241/m.28914 type:complete len:296 (-) Transcript_8241:284-1171(-)
MLPIMAQLAPSASAFVMWPLFWMPPSAMMGTPSSAAARAVLYTAVACPRPTAHTSCVVQMDPLPMPTLRPSAPAWHSRAACAPVTTLPAMTSRPACVRLRCLIMSSWYTESPWELSRTTASTPSLTSIATRSLSPSLVPTAAQHSRRPSGESEGAPGGGHAALRESSALVATALSSPSGPTTGSFPFLLLLSVRSISSGPVPSASVTTSAVITSLSGVCLSATNSTSRLVTMPSSFPPSAPVSVTAADRKPREARRASTSATVASGRRTAGRATVCGRWALTAAACDACVSAVML